MDTVLDSDSSFTGEYARDFEIWAEYYDSQPEVDVLSTHAEFTGKKVLEGGCGSGRLSFRVSQDDFHLTCVDIVPSLIQHCHKRLIETFAGDQTQLRFEVQDIQDLPYPDDYFDVVLDGWTFSTLEDFDVGAAEYKRVLDADGALYAIEFREGSPYQRIIDKFIPEDAYEEDLPDPDTIMQNAFGEATATEKIVSEYRFPTQQEAFEAFWFNFTEWIGLDLSEEDAQDLKKELESYQTDDGISIEEHAKFYRYDTVKNAPSKDS